MYVAYTTLYRVYMEQSIILYVVQSPIASARAWGRGNVIVNMNDDNDNDDDDDVIYEHSQNAAFYYLF